MKTGVLWKLRLPFVLVALTALATSASERGAAVPCGDGYTIAEFHCFEMTEQDYCHYWQDENEELEIPPAHPRGTDFHYFYDENGTYGWEVFNEEHEEECPNS